MYHHEFYGTKGEIHPYRVEGIGEDFMPSTLNLKIIDEIITVNDRDAFLTARELAQKEGIFAGGSAGAAVFAALQVGRKLGKNQTVVVILPDTGRNYLNKIYSDEWMTENGYIEGKEEKIAVKDILKAKTDSIKQLVSVDPDDELSAAIQLMRKYDISQLPVIRGNVPVGSIREGTVMKKLADKPVSRKQKVCDFMEAPLPSVKKGDKIVSPLNLMKNNNAITVTEDGRVTDIIATIDVVNYLLER